MWKKSLKRRPIGIVVYAVLILSFGAGSLFAEAQDDDYVVAEIGAKEIYFSEIERAAKGLNRFLRENFETSKDWRLNFVRQYIAQIALTKRAEGEGIDKDEDVIFNIEKARRGILADKILNKRLAKIEITEEDLKRHYQENKVKYQIKERIKISYIKVKSKKGAEKIIARLNKGKSFQQAAGKKKVKLDNWISKGAPFIPELEEVAPEALTDIFGLGVGGSSQAIEAKDNFYIFHIDEKEPAKDRPFEEVRRQVESEVNRKERDSAINNFIMETFTQESVRIYENRISEHMQ